MAPVNTIKKGFYTEYAKIKSKKNKKKTDSTQCDYLFNTILYCAGLTASNPVNQYNALNDIFDSWDYIYDLIKNKKKGKINLKPDVSVIGSITEKICEIGLKASGLPYQQLPDDWKWLADFVIPGIPFNLFTSVKSYSAKERLMASGSGSFSAPIIGYGLFNDPSEFSPQRVKQFKQRGFIAIYMPDNLYNTLYNQNPNNPTLSPQNQKKYTAANGYPSTDIKNIHERPLLRRLATYANDLNRLLTPNSPVIDLSIF